MNPPDRLLTYFKSLHLTQKEIAKKFGVSQASVNDVFKHNTTNISAKLYEPLVKEGVNIHWLLLGEGTMLRDQAVSTKKINQGDGSIAQVGQTNTARQNNSSGVDMQVQIDDLTKELKHANKLLAAKDETIEALRAHIESLKTKVQ